MDFGNPVFLNALYAVPLLVLLLVHGTRRRASDLVRFTGSRLSERLAPGRSWRRNLLKSGLKTTALVLVILAAAKPQFGSQLVKVQREGIDLVIALDASLSMMAEDMKPNRLERAKQEIVDLIQGLKGDRVGVVAFAGDAFVLCPLTVDYNAALMFTQTADVDIVSKQGTAIDKAIDTSVALFNEDGESDRVIILVTDGESHDGDPVESARQAAVKGIRIYTIGIGNPAGELIPLRGTDGAVEEYKKDRAGETVLTRLDERVLREVARVTDGKYLPATRDGLELKVLYREISGLQRAAVEGEFVERKTDRFQWFLGLAALLLALEMIITRRGAPVPTDARRVLHSGIAGAIALVVMLAAGGAAAKSIDRGRVKAGNQYFESGEYEKALSLYREAVGDSLRYVDLSEGVLYNEANSLHMLERYEEALSKYQASLSEDSTQTGQMFYNRGNTLLLMSKTDEAIESYVQSLSYAPDDEDARHNLELALKLKQMQQQQQQQQDQQGDDQEKQEQDQQEQNQEQQGGDQEQDQQQQDQQGQQDQPDSTQTNQPQQMDSTQAQPQESIKLTREDALRILRLLEEQEKELQKAKRKAAMKRATRGKDW
jgi:Ca-activated chloride channel family protein